MPHAPHASDSIPPNGQRRPIPEDQLLAVQHAFQDLALCDSLDKVKEIRDKAEAVRQYARSAKISLDLQNSAAELKLRAERRAGELLHAMRLRGGDRVSESAHCRTTLEQLDISENQSTRWQKLAAIPEADFEAFLTPAHRNEMELTTACLLRMATTRAKMCAAPPGLSRIRARCVPRQSPGTASPEEIIAELLNHCQVLDNILSPLYDGDAPVELCVGERRHLRRLFRDVRSLLADLQARPPGKTAQ